MIVCDVLSETNPFVSGGLGLHNKGPIIDTGHDPWSSGICRAIPTGVVRLIIV